MKEERCPRSTAALAVFLLFAAVLFSVAPAEASIPRGVVAGEASASLQLHEYSLGACALTPCRFTFAEGVSLIDTEHAPRAFSLIGSETSRCERTYARNNPLKYVDPDGLDFIKFGKQNVEVYPGEVLFIQQARGGLHTFTYVEQGANGEVLGYENTSFRNLEATTPQSAAAQKKRNPEWTGDKHDLVDLTSEWIGPVKNENSPISGASIIGVVPIKGGLKDLDRSAIKAGAEKTRMFWSSPTPQCTTFCLALAKSSGYMLKANGDSTRTFRKIAEENKDRVK